MKIVQINATCGVGSTGKICVGISKILNEHNIENYILYSAQGNGYERGIQNTTSEYLKFQALKTRVFGNYGFNSKKATRKMIRTLKQIDPDIVHLHNIHGHDCNFEMLLQYLKAENKKVIWTFHDCWAFTALCPHFTMVGCDKWKTQCRECPQYRNMSWLFDRSKELFARKKKAFEGLDLTIVTPSQWLCDLVKESFLKDYPVKVIHNGIDLSVFKPTDGNFRKKYHLENKFIVLGVAFGWSKRKGLDVFIELSKQLPEQYQIVLVGTTEEIDKQLPPNIISVHRTQNQEELAELYTAADVFANPTREEVLGLVNIEALACGTPVITFNTGGSPECVTSTCGIVVSENIQELLQKITYVCEQRPFSERECIKQAAEFDMNDKFLDCAKLYECIDDE